MTILDRDDVDRKPASVGVPPPLYALRILDGDGARAAPGEVGEIVGRGPITMPGYYRRPELTAETLRDGWISSGDLGYVDDDGFLLSSTARRTSSSPAASTSTRATSRRSRSSIPTLST